MSTTKNDNDPRTDTYISEVIIHRMEDGKRTDQVEEISCVEAKSIYEAHRKVETDLIALLADPEVKEWAGDIGDYSIEVLYETASCVGNYEALADDIADSLLVKALETLKDDDITDGQSAVALKRLSEYCMYHVKDFFHRSEHPLKVQYDAEKELAWRNKYR